MWRSYVGKQEVYYVSGSIESDGDKRAGNFVWYGSAEKDPLRVVTSCTGEGGVAAVSHRQGSFQSAGGWTGSWSTAGDKWLDYAGAKLCGYRR